MSKKSIAIMGAGLSGLACAFELEKHGFIPEIYDDRREVEDKFMNMEGMMDILTRPISDCFAYLADNYNLYLTPQNPIKRMDLCSENYQTFIEGQLGFFTVRGRHPNSLGKQIADKVKSRIHFNSKKDYHTLALDYDTVVLATGDGHQTRRLQKYKNDVSVKIKGATLHGNFDQTCVKIILNNHFAPKGYTYLLPYDNKKANLAIATAVNDADMDSLWSNLLKHLQYSGPLTEHFQIRDYLIGRPEKLRIGNTYFIGNCGGYTMPFMGFGQFGAILSGLLAGRSIALGLDFEEEATLLKKSYTDSLRLRRIMEDMNNQDFDRLVLTLHGTLGQKLFAAKRYNILKLGARLVAPYVHAKKRPHT